MKEKISALLDEELPKREREETVKTVSKDEELSDLWHRYNLIGALFRREVATHSPVLARRVAQLIGHDQGERSSSTSATFTDRSPVWTWVPTVAIAASIMAVLGIGIYTLNLDSVTRDVNKQSSAVAINDRPTRWENVIPEHEDQLNALLVEHGEFTPMAGLNGLISYAKFVSYDSRQ